MTESDSDLRSRTRWHLAALLCAAAVLAGDLMLELGVSAGIGYVLVVLLAFASRSARSIWVAAVGCSILTLVGLALSPPSGDYWKALTNRALVLLALSGSAFFCLRVLALLESERKRLVRLFASGASRRAREAEQKLEDVAARLVIPEPAVGPATEKHSVCDFSLADMVACGSLMRELSQRSNSFGSYASEVTQALHRCFRNQGEETEFALVRVYRARRFSDLSNAQKELALTRAHDVDESTVCLTLEGTTGDQPAWCAPAVSESHQVIPMISEEALQGSPLSPEADWIALEMVARLVSQLGESETYDSTLSGVVLHEQEAAGSSNVRGQSDFVSKHGIKSAVCFGNHLPGGSKFAVAVFSKETIIPEVAEMFAHLAHSIRLALITLLDTEEKTAAQIFAVDQLLAHHEQVVTDHEASLRRTMKELGDSNRALKESNLDLEQFAYVASHDLQEPLRAIVGYSQLLLMELSEEAAGSTELLNHVVEGGERMQQMISDLLAYSRVNRTGAPPQLVDMSAVVSRALRNLESAIKESDARMEVEALPKIPADARQLEQLFQNLVQNAIKYRSDDTPVIHIRAHEETDHWLFTVSDNGIGISSEFFEQIFVIFKRLHTRREYGGTGIGLALCKRIVDRHGGEIDLESTPGAGSTFRVRLPKAPLT